MKQKFYRTTVVIWTKEDPSEKNPLDILENMEYHVSYRNSREMNEPLLDPHYDHSDFFEVIE
jgi:hypothetical protein